MERKPIDVERKPIDLERQSIDSERKSFDLERKPINLKRKPIDLGKKSIDLVSSLHVQVMRCILATTAHGMTQLLEGFVLTPKLVGNSTGLHPVWVIFAVMAGGELGGFLGMLIALPLATVLTVLIPQAFHLWLKERAKHKNKKA